MPKSPPTCPHPLSKLESWTNRDRHPIPRNQLKLETEPVLLPLPFSLNTQSFFPIAEKSQTGMFRPVPEMEARTSKTRKAGLTEEVQRTCITPAQNKTFPGPGHLILSCIKPNSLKSPQLFSELSNSQRTPLPNLRLCKQPLHGAYLESTNGAEFQVTRQIRWSRHSAPLPARKRALPQRHCVQSCTHNSICWRKEYKIRTKVVKSTSWQVAESLIGISK
jgi:hypothetical protein